MMRKGQPEDIKKAISWIEGEMKFAASVETTDLEV
jgi:hypothetical protein